VSAGGEDRDGGEARPVLRVVRGDATPEEVAALVAVLGSLAGRSTARDDGDPGSVWADRRAALRTDLGHGPGAWRSSFWPR
jgi:hypothetical protein